MYILSIESSCDDTSIAILHFDKVLSNVISSQFIHASYGGVVPELASREHLTNIIPVLNKALNDAKINLNDINYVAFTEGPGLLGSLLVGNSFAKSLSLSLGIPLLSINHMEAHIFAHFINIPFPSFPFLCLIVSGGHTSLVVLRDMESFEIIGETKDDAIGEAFDKAANLLGFSYPGGAKIDKCATNGDFSFIKFPKVSLNGFDFSFSGIKTAFLYFLKDKSNQYIATNLNDICASYQKALIDMVLNKTIEASSFFNIKNIGIAGGVSANTFLRQQILSVGQENDWNVFIPPFEYCTDNAAMIGIAAYYKILAKRFSSLHKNSNPRLKIHS